MMMLLLLLMSMPTPNRNAVLPTPMSDLFDLTLILPPFAPFEIVPCTMMMVVVALSA